MNYKNSIITTIIILITLIIIFMLTLLLFSKKNRESPIKTLPTPTPISLQPTIKEDKQLEKGIDLLENRQPLSQTDSQAKETIIQLQPSNLDDVFATEEFQISYIKVFDEFQVEIDSTNVKSAMSNAVQWFQSQGMSLDGICKLPILFYGGYLLKQENISVPSLAEQCQ